MIKDKFGSVSPIFYFDGRKRSLPPLTTHTRPSTSTVMQNNAIKVIAANTPCFGKDTHTGLEGLIARGQSLNHLISSCDFSKWSAVKGTHKVSNVLAPDGKSLASTIVPSTDNSEHYFADYGCNLDGKENNWYAYSVYVKSGSEKIVCIRLGNTNDYFSSAFFNLVTSEINVTGGTYADVYPEMHYIGDGWFHCTAIFFRRAVVGVLGLNAYIYPSRNMSNNAFIGDDVKEAMYFWGAQYENGDSASPLIALDQAKAVGAEDKIDFPSFNFDRDNFTITATVATPVRSRATLRDVFEFYNTDTTERVFGVSFSGNSIYLRSISDSMGMGEVDLSKPVKIAITNGPGNSLHCARSGSNDVSSAFSKSKLASSGRTHLKIGTGLVGNSQRIVVSDVRVYSQNFTNEMLLNYVHG